jgi:predicted rRNA methylase YqxC with S4 and FtsJ domains
VRQAVVERIRQWGIEEGGLKWIGVCESPIQGPAGNVEFLACWKKQRCCPCCPGTLRRMKEEEGRKS